MLTSLRVRDLAVLEDVEVSFEIGLTVLTGETGAGKSLVVDALSLLAGDRADASLVRAGAERAVVEGAFETSDPAVMALLCDAGLVEEQGEAGAIEVVIRREIARGGKGKLSINGSPAVLKTLVELAPRLLVIYGQAGARELLDASAPRDFLDRFAGLSEQASLTRSLFTQWQSLEEKRRRLFEMSADAGRRLDLLEFQIREIDSVNPRDGEEETLQTERLALSTVEKRGKLMGQAGAALESDDGGCLPALAAARKSMQSLADFDSLANGWIQALDEAEDRLSDIARSVARELSRLEADPNRLATVAERLDALAKLKRKYGPTLAEVMDYRERIGRERDELSDLSGSLARAEEAARKALSTFRSESLRLSEARRKAAPRLGSATERHLQDLAFLRASFSVECSLKGDVDSPFEIDGERVACGSYGIDQVSFSFAPNPGEPARPLSKIASGGELSRVQLALAAALDSGSQKLDRPSGRALVFDEVDTGVSGATAAAVGRKLRQLSKNEQILVVTHLPQVAASGTSHLAVKKEESAGRTKTTVRALSQAERMESIAALLAGAEVKEAAREHARQLLEGFLSQS